MGVGIEPRPRDLALLPLLVLGAGVAAGLVAFLGLDHLGVTLCMFKATTGLPCMTCGTTRAVARLARLDPVGALRVNPLVTVTLLAFFLAGILDSILLSRGLGLKIDFSRRTVKWFLIVFGILLLVNWAYLIAAGV
jgi:hypothetical protein